MAYPLNELFISTRATDVVRFFSHFESRPGLIQWMKERPVGKSTVHEIDGEKDCIVVIPTADASGPMAMNCKRSVFKGLQIIFIESERPRDPYFNLARNVNVGARLALRYNPAWIIYAGDDMIQMEKAEILLDRLRRISESDYDAVFTRPEGYYHSILANLGKQNLLRRLAFGYSSTKRAILKIERKFGINLFDSRASGYQRLFFHKGYRHLSIASFGIVSAKWVATAGGTIFNEGFLNDALDIELSLRLTRDQSRYSFIDYRISEQHGATMGRGDSRRLRMLANNAYLQELIERHPASYFPSNFDFRTLSAT
jgi:hypothetical protein